MVYSYLLSPPYFYYLLFAVAALWLLLLTLVLLRYVLHYRKLVKKTGKRGLKTILDELLRVTDQNQKDLLDLAKKLDRVEKESAKHLQKIGFLRFNPFSDTGGDQSFIMAILNGRGDGLILSSLHSRGTTRLYAKEVAKGRSKTFDLSKEEQQVVKRLLKKVTKKEN